MSWTAVPGATGYVLEADSTDSSFSVLYANPTQLPCVSAGALGVTGFPPPPPPPSGTCATTAGNYAEPGTVYFRVQAVNASGALSVPSNVDTATISYSAPLTAPPEPTTPASTATVTFPFTVSFTNVPDPQENAYEVQFSTSSSFRSIEYDVPLINPTIPFATIPRVDEQFHRAAGSGRRNHVLAGAGRGRRRVGQHRGGDGLLEHPELHHELSAARGGLGDARYASAA